MKKCHVFTLNMNIQIHLILLQEHRDAISAHELTRRLALEWENIATEQKKVGQLGFHHNIFFEKGLSM